MQAFDMRTLSLVNVVGAVSVALLLAFLWRFVSQDYGMVQWVLGSALLAVGSVLLLLRDIAPDWLSIAASNGLCILGTGYLALGARRFSNRRDGLPWHWIGALTCALTAWYFTEVSPSLRMRVFQFSLWTACFALLGARALWLSSAPGKFGVAQRFTAGVFYAVAVIMGLRSVLIWLVNPGQDYMKAVDFAVASGSLAQLLSNATMVVGVTMILNNRLQERLTKMSYLDGLTGISNRRFFDEAYRYEQEKLHHSYQTLSVILIDIDFFKQFNDCYGHQKGDDCLVQVARAIESARPAPDVVVARYGGEEFVVLLPGVTLAAAERLADEIAAAIIALRIPHSGSVIGGVSHRQPGHCLRFRRQRRGAVAPGCRRPLLVRSQAGRAKPVAVA